MNTTRKIILLFILASMMILAGCESATDSATEVLPDSAPAQMGRIISDDGILQFNSKSLYKGDKLSITMPQPHPKELAIRAPDGRWFYLHIENEGAEEMLMSSKQFAALQKLDLDTRQLEARYWSDGKAMYGQVFTQTGDYLIYMADNLETEQENTLSFASIIHYTDTEKADWVTLSKPDSVGRFFPREEG